MEHRIGHRQSINEAVLLCEGSNNTVRGIVTDLSISGAFIRAQSSLGPESTLKVFLKRSGEGKLPSASVLAHVVRQAADGFAVEWAQFAPRAICIRLNKRWLYENEADMRQLSASERLSERPFSSKPSPVGDESDSVLQD
jgi:hypothetical protein